MTKLSRAVIVSIAATMMLPSAASIAGADTFTYELNGSYAESNGGPSLVPLGGTLGPTGYTFGVNTGLSLSGTGIFDAYSIDIRFFFYDVSASINSFQKILDFKNRTSDSGLYDSGGAGFERRDNQEKRKRRNSKKSEFWKFSFGNRVRCKPGTPAGGGRMGVGVASQCSPACSAVRTS
jgi:hypothetical protein